MRKRILSSIVTLLMVAAMISTTTVNTHAQGEAKPSVDGLGQEVPVTVISEVGSQGSSGLGLFNGVTANQWNTANVCYWEGGTHYVEIEFAEAVNIWRAGTEEHKHYTTALKIEKYVDGSYVDITDQITQTTSPVNENEWEKTIVGLEAGRYKLSGTGLRIDSEWYLESVAGQTASEAFVLESEKTEYNQGDIIEIDLYDTNAVNLCATDVRLTYDTTKFEYVGATSETGIDKLHEEHDATTGDLRYIFGIDGKDHIMNGKSKLATLKFKAIAGGEGKVDVTIARIADNGTYEKNVAAEHCGEILININEVLDVDRSGEFTLIDLAIDAFYKYMTIADTDTTKYDADVVVNSQVDMDDLSKIVENILANTDYEAQF